MTGIDVIGAAPWGTHVCQFYEAKKDLSSVIVPYFRAGLENNEVCIWITSEPLGVEEATRELDRAINNLDFYMAKGQMQIVEHSEWYTEAGTFDGDKVLHHLVERERLALDGDFDGVRVSGNTSWLSQEQWASFVDYESAVDNSIRNHRIIAICSYLVDRYGPAEIVDIVSNHRLILIRRAGRWELIPNNANRWVNSLRSHGLSYAEIGYMLGLSRQRIAQIVGIENKGRSVASNRRSDTLLSTSQAAEFLGVHVNTVRRWSDTGILQAYRIGYRHDRKFRQADLDEFLRKTVVR